MKKPTLLASSLLLAAAVSIFAAGSVTASAKKTVSIVGSTSVQPLAEELAKAFMKANPGVTITVAGGGSGTGIKAVRAGQTDIGASSRELTPEEKKGLAEAVIARDGIALVVNPGNKVAGLAMAQVAGIYTGRIKNWHDVGGDKAPIVLISREAGSGTRGAFEELVLGKTPPAKNLLVQGSTGAVRQTVAISKNAIGYISLGQLDKTVKALKIGGVAASEANVLNGTYAISRPFLFLTKGPAKGAAKLFIDFVLSPKGQAVVAKEFVPVRK